MAIEIKHPTQVDTEAFPDDPAYPVGGGAWNAGHSLTMAGPRIVGRTTSGTGEAEELTATQAKALLGIGNASTTVAGLVERATDSEMAAGTATGVVPDVKQVADYVADNAGGGSPTAVSAVKTDTFTTTSTSYVTVTGLSVTITPSSASSRILLIAMVNVGAPNNQTAFVTLARGTTDLVVPDSPGSRTTAGGVHPISGSSVDSVVTIPLVYVDSPATTSATTYNVRLKTSIAAQTTGVNRSNSDGNAAAQPRTISTLIAMEISA